MFAKATLWDRAFGGSTMIIHVEGSNNPGAPALPECIKADVYLPPVIVSEHPESHATIAAMVQSFIEQIGVPTIQRWTRAGKKCGWSLAQSGHAYTHSSIPHDLVPTPFSGTSHYQFFGRPYGSFSMPAVLSKTNPVPCVLPIDHPMPQSTPIPLIQQPASAQSECFLSEEPLSSSTIGLLNALEEIEALKSQLESAKHRELGLVENIQALFTRLDGAEADNAELRNQLATHPSTFGSDISSISYISDFTQTPGRSPSKRNELSLKFPPVDVTQFPRPVTTQQSPSTPRALRSPAVQRSSRKADISYPHLTLSPPLSPSHDDHLGQATRVQQSVPTSHVDTFLKRHALDEKLAVSLGLLEHIPAPSWHQVVGSLDIAETQRAGLMEALTKDWMAKKE